MNIELIVTESNLVIKCDEEDKFSYSLDQQIDLTEFVKYVGELESLITTVPIREEIIESMKQSDIMKLVEYIKQIISAFNESFTEVAALPD